MSANGGFTDKIQVLEETAYGDGGSTGEIVFGNTIAFEWDADTSTIQSYGLETDGPQASFNTDGVLLVSGTHEWEITDGRELKSIFGTINDGAGGTFDLDVANTLPSYTVKVVDEFGDSKFKQIKGIKYGNASIGLTREETIKVSAEWQGKVIEDTTTFTPTEPSVEPLSYLDGDLTIGSTAQVDVDNFTLEIQRNNVARRFIESTSTGERRLISCIIEGPLNLSFNGEMSAKEQLIEEILGGSSMQDVRTDKTVTLNMARGSDTALNIPITGARLTTNGRPMQKDNEVAIQSFDGVGRDITATGTYPTS